MIIKPKKNDKILILGAGGNLGGQLMRVFGNDYRLVCWDRSEINVTDKDMVSSMVSDIKPDYIINATAYNAVDKCEESEEEYELAKKLNGDAVGYIADAAIENDAVMIHFSTDYVFGGYGDDELIDVKKNKGFREGDNTNPINKYAETKQMGEKEVLSRFDKGLKYYLIRTSKLFGPVGESDIAKPSFFDIMLKLAKEKDALNVVDEEISCFTYTPDLAKATYDLLVNRSEYGIYHFINEGAVTWYEATKELIKMAKLKVKLVPVSGEMFPRPAKRPIYSVLNNTKVNKFRSYKDALKEYLKSLD